MVEKSIPVTFPFVHMHGEYFIGNSNPLTSTIGTTHYSYNWAENITISPKPGPPGPTVIKEKVRCSICNADVPISFIQNTFLYISESEIKDSKSPYSGKEILWWKFYNLLPEIFFFSLTGGGLLWGILWIFLAVSHSIPEFFTWTNMVFIAFPITLIVFALATFSFLSYKIFHSSRILVKVEPTWYSRFRSRKPLGFSHPSCFHLITEMSIDDKGRHGIDLTSGGLQQGEIEMVFCRAHYFPRPSKTNTYILFDY